MELESAIPAHLVQERTLPVSTPPNYQPPFPAYSARFPKHVKDLVMAVIGAQHQTRPTTTSTKSTALLKLLEFVQEQEVPEPHRPQYWQLASVTDNTGAFNEVVITYWQSKPHYLQWASTSGFQTWWDDIDASTTPHGWFKEVFFPPIDRFETVFSDNEVPEGAAHMREGVSGPIKEHVYWGSMRDRLPASQTSHLPGEKMSSPADLGVSSSERQQRVRVPGRTNLAIIRSGQDWSDTNPVERKLYLETMHPVLVTGMDFLRDRGPEVGCISNRFMDVLDADTMQGPTAKTFGLGYFDDLASLEGWSKQHTTHLDIFGRFLQYARELQNNVTLRLFHEVLVVESDQQDLEYVACHPRTGLLAAR